MNANSQRLLPALRRGLIAAAGLAAVLAVLGLLIFPDALADWHNSLPGLAGVLFVLAGYAALGPWAFARLERLDARLLRLALLFGLLAGAIYSIEIVAEYILLPNDNTTYGLVEFGLVFLCYLLAGFSAGWLARRVGYRLLAAVGAALISTVIWYCVLLATSYVMKGTPQQALVFRAEGDLVDFAQSGAANFQAWMMEDFLGAGFYHLLLGPLVAAILGALGALAGKAATWRPSRSQPRT